MKKSLLMSLVGSLIAFLLVLGAYWLSYSMVTAKSIEASKLATQIDTEKSATAELTQAKSELAGLTSQKATINQYFVQTNNIVPFLEQLQLLGSSLGATVQVASVSASQGSPYGTLTLSLSISGNFNAVAKTLGAIEYEPYNISITSLSFTHTPNIGSASSTPQWSAVAEFIVGAETGTATSTKP